MLTMTIKRAELLSYLRGIIIAGKPFTGATAGAALGRSAGAINREIYSFRQHGLIRTEATQIGSVRRIRVIIDGLGSTPWPDLQKPSIIRKDAKVDALTEEQRIVSARERVERQRMEHRQACLAREFRGKGKGPSASNIDPYAAAIARAYRMS